MHDWSLSDLLIEVSGTKKTDKENGIRDRKADVGIVDWCLDIDLDLGTRASSTVSFIPPIESTTL
jgi:hypothetical protein